MAKINLRPWREELRAERQKQFLTALVGVFLIASGIGFLWYQSVTGQIEYQRQRNNFIQSEIAQLEKQIKEIDELRRRREALIDRMRVIQDLQGRRPVIVRVFDELVKTIPEGVFYQRLALNGETLQLNGVGDTNSRISTLMRNLDASDWFSNPNLTLVKAWEQDEERSEFAMTVIQKSPGSEEGAKGPGKGRARK